MGKLFTKTEEAHESPGAARSSSRHLVLSSQEPWPLTMLLDLVGIGQHID